MLEQSYYDKADSIIVNPSGRVTSDRAEQPQNVLVGIEVTLFGIVISIVCITVWFEKESMLTDVLLT